MEKILYLGKTVDGNVWVKVTLENGKLSIHGVVGPKPNGNCTGSCGQIHSDLKDFIEYGEGWNSSLVVIFFKIWERWHLNDMRAGCQHQIDDGIDSEAGRKVKIYKF